MQPNSPTAPDSQAAGIPRLSTRIPEWGYTKKYRSLWARRIGDFAALKSHLQATTTFVSLDVESYPDGRITEIGMAFLPCIGHERPANITEFAEKHNVLFRCLKIRSQGQQEPRRKREHFKWRLQEATVQEIDIDSAETKIIEFLEYIREASHVKHVTFIGFAMNAEFNSLFHQMPAVVQYISAWVDIQPIIWEVDRLAGTPTNLDHLPSMSVAMAGFAFEKGYQPTSFRHCAGNDAVRILALFTCLAHTPTSGIRLRLEQLHDERPQTQQKRNAYRQTRKGSLIKSRRFIIENYPFRAVLRMQDRKCPGPEIHSPLRLQEYFSEYSIEATCQHGKHANGHPRDKDRECGYYVVCFNSADKLAKFVEENDQRALNCGRKLRVFKMDNLYKPVDRKAVASTREKNKENLDKEREDGLGLDFISNMEDMLI
ncbi:hypothetical protein F4801DRAFT_569099 [Xylaria longipes]|nr:hypothetical protein F4801DRAFT_569099 [Xylaria longipes]RYC62022.1 hypothetical protein CHU98_g4187 [Xylaria longipes]